MSSKRRYSSGFTLVELIVSMTILLLLGGGLLSNYNGYNQTQLVKGAILKLKNDLRYAQTLATAAQRPPAGCVNFGGYISQFTLNSYTISAFCDGIIVAATSKTTNLAQALVFSLPPPNLVFLPLSGRVGIGADVVITITGPNNIYHLRVSQSGNMTEF